MVEGKTIILTEKPSVAREFADALSNKIEKFKKAQHTLIENINIEIPEKIFLDTQIDGEFHNFKTNKIEVSIIKSGLEVLTQ